ncbi:MAG TPA: lipoate--protein ligase family protein [Gemmataceae bacterium]|nr:lipoate--protein ligase family protein [Gemmataceae bacterium]
MRRLDLILPTLVENLALDEALLLDAEAGGPEVLRLWQWPSHAVVLGAGGRIGDDVHEEACRIDNVPIARRSSGGGTVLLGAGCLLFSLVLRFDRHPALGDLHASYRYIFDRIRIALKPSVGPVSLQGSSDFVLGDRKFSGNAQQRKRTHFLHHGSLLYDFDFTALDRYLKPPPRQPEYRRQRTHADFLVNLPLDPAMLAQKLCDAWEVEALATWPEKLVQQLVEERYSQSQWIRRR